MVGVLTLVGSLLLLAGASVTYAQTGDTGSVPDTPDGPSGSALWVGMIDLHWNEVPGADSYDIQYFHISRWIDLPVEDEHNLDIDITFYGAGAVVRGLRPSGSYTFRVRAVNSHGASDWSDYGWVPPDRRACGVGKCTGTHERRRDRRSDDQRYAACLRDTDI